LQSSTVAKNNKKNCNLYYTNQKYSVMKNKLSPNIEKIQSFVEFKTLAVEVSDIDSINCQAGIIKKLNVFIF
jgi:hypothetical protein